MRHPLFTLVAAACLCGLSGCEFALADLMANTTVTCNDIQSAADSCWASANADDGESQCEDLDWQAASCSWGPADSVAATTADEDDEDDGDDGDEGHGGGHDAHDDCDDLALEAEACWEDGEEDPAVCEYLERELEECES